LKTPNLLDGGGGYLDLRRSANRLLATPTPPPEDPNKNQWKIEQASEKPNSC